MLFNSYEFIFIFLPLSFFIYFYLLEKRLVVGAKGFLVFASLFFYSWWNVAYLPIILSSMLFNYVIGNSLNENLKKVRVHKKSLLSFGVIANIALLVYFKYADFFLENFNLAFDSSLPLLHLALPLAISFFTFQQIAYLVDSYRGETTEYDFLNYSLFVTFFPQLIAGPIVHHEEMMPQFASRWNMVKNYKNISTGLFIFSIGLFKKVVIADTFATWATTGFDHTEILSNVEAWATSLSYTFQLYFDFSGYTDMAIGAALLFNIRLPVNFNSPYKALSIQDFWRRWHITLSRFLKAYIYIPLGGNRNGNVRAYANVLTTFVLGGIWHGAGWTFIFWGLLHGVALIVHRLWGLLDFTLPRMVAWFITFNFINISWVFFRANEWQDAINVLSSMMAMKNISFPENGFKELLENIDGNSETIIYLSVAFVIVLFFKNSFWLRNNFNPTKLNLSLTAVMVFYSLISLNKISEFLYFNF